MWVVARGCGRSLALDGRVGLEPLCVQSAKLRDGLGVVGVHDSIAEHVHGVHVGYEPVDERVGREFLCERVEHVSVHALALDGLLLPQALEVVGAEGELLQGDDLVLAKFIVVDFALELDSVNKPFLAAAAGGAFVEVSEEKVAGLLSVELVGNVEKEHLTGLGRVIYH